jgi:hypothetical protein
MPENVGTTEHADSDGCTEIDRERGMRIAL